MDVYMGAEGALPRRQAAKTALANFADQLDSDSADAHSGSDGEGGTAGRRGRAKAVQKNGIANAKKTRRRAATVQAEQPLSRAANPSSSSQGQKAPMLSSPASQKFKAKSLPSPSSPTSSAVSAMPPPPRPRPAAKKPTPATLPPLIVSHSLDLADLSDLTPLSSACTSATVGTFEGIEPAASASGSEARSACVAAQPSKEYRKPIWSTAALGTYVWALVEPKTWRVCDEEREEEEEDGEWIWWPGKIASARNTDIPLKIKLFGVAKTVVSIKTPSARTVLSRDLDYLPRFSAPTFVPPIPFSTTASKKRKFDRDAIEEKWKAAADAMRRDDAAAATSDDDMDSDEFPDVANNMFKFLTASTSSKSVSAPARASSSQSGSKISATAKGKRKRAAVSESSADEAPRSYVNKKKDKKEEVVPDEVDDHEEMELPGELILGRTAAPQDIDHWPGQLLEYVPPSKPKARGKYLVQWLDGSKGLIPRSWFYITDQDEFATCKLGQFDSAVVEVQNDDDNDEIQAAVELAQRVQSPVPLDTPPAGPEFAQLPIREQFVYTKDVLQAILRNEYEPLREKQARYMKGGKHRQSLVQGSSLRGKMDARDVNDLLAYVREWCLRDGGRAAGPGGDLNLTSQEGSVIEIEEEEVAEAREKETQAMATVIPESTLANSVVESDGLRDSSPPPIADFPSSPQLPPSSFVPTALERELSLASVLSDIEGAKPPSSPAAMSHSNEPGTTSIVNEAIEQDTSALTSPKDHPAKLTLSSRPRQRGFSDFEDLSDLEKVDYCLNILLPEAIRQILLWRNGYRTSVGLLSPAEERRLYDAGSELLSETDWVLNVMRYRKLTQELNAFNRSKEKQPPASRRELGRGARLRRNISIPNYQE